MFAFQLWQRLFKQYGLKLCLASEGHKFTERVVMGKEPVEKKPFDIDLIEEYLEFSHGVLALAHDSLSSGEITTISEESVARVLLEAGHRIREVKETLSHHGLEL